MIEVIIKYIPEIISTLLTTVGSVATVFIVDAIKKRHITPTQEFLRIRRKTNSTLQMYADVYSNPISLANEERYQKVKDYYEEAQTKIREVAVELCSFLDDYKKGKFKGIKKEDIYEASRELIGLSNSFYFNSDESRYDNYLDNNSRAKRIRELLKINIK